MHGARTEGVRLLANVNIRDAIEIEKERVANIKGVTRELLLDIMIGMALANPGDFDEVLKDPENPENYARLGNKVHAIKSWCQGIDQARQRNQAARQDEGNQ
jgi:hypothetical protein